MDEDLQVTETVDVEEGVEETTPAELSDPVDEDTTNPADETTEVEEEKPVDVNAIAAAARRKAEQEARDTQARIDAEFTRRFGNYKNPITGEPIRSQADYLAALDAQEQMKAENDLRAKGVDPNLINQLVQNNPIVRQANDYLEKAKQQEVMNEINNHVAELSQLDPNIKTLADVPREVVQMAVERDMPLTDAYKILNFGKTSAQKAEAIRQSAINQAKGKAHLNPMNGVAVSDNSVEIPSRERGRWEAMFPNKSYAELKKLYNQQL